MLDSLKTDRVTSSYICIYNFTWLHSSIAAREEI